MLELFGAVQFKKECTSGHDFLNILNSLVLRKKGVLI